MRLPGFPPNPLVRPFDLYGGRGREAALSDFDRSITPQGAALMARLGQKPPSLYDRYGRPALEAVGGVVSAPFRGLGMGLTALQEGLADTPDAESRLRLDKPDSNVLDDILGRSVTSAPTPARLALEGYKGIGEELARDLFPDVLETPSAGRTPEDARAYARAFPTISRAQAVLDPVTELGLQFVTDPALAAFGALGKTAEEAKTAQAAIESGVLPRSAAAAAEATVSRGRAANIAEKALGASFVPGMAEAAVHGGQAAGESFRREGLSPETLRTGTQAVLDAILAGTGAVHALTPEMRATGAPREAPAYQGVMDDLMGRAPAGEAPPPAAETFVPETKPFEVPPDRPFDVWPFEAPAAEPPAAAPPPQEAAPPAPAPDPVLETAANVVRKAGQASVGTLVEQMGVSPSKARRILTKLQETGVLTAPDKNGARALAEQPAAAPAPPAADLQPAAESAPEPPFRPDLAAAADAEQARKAREFVQDKRSPTVQAIEEAIGAPAGEPRLTGTPALAGPGAEDVRFSPEAARAAEGEGVRVPARGEAPRTVATKDAAEVAKIAPGIERIPEEELRSRAEFYRKVGFKKAAQVAKDEIGRRQEAKTSSPTAPVARSTWDQLTPAEQADVAHTMGRGFSKGHINGMTVEEARAMIPNRKPQTPPEGGAPVAPAPPSEEAPKAHKFSSTQVNLPGPVAEKVLDFARRIPDEDLGVEGREKEPHVTVKYGLHTEDVQKVRDVLAGEPPIKVKLGKTSLFPPSESSSGADVVKVDVDSPDLHRLNAKISKALETTDSHPEYEPHVTIAYVKAGEGKKYAGSDALAGQEMTLDHITFSSKSGETFDIPLGEGGVSDAQERRQAERRTEAVPVPEDRRAAERRTQDNAGFEPPAEETPAPRAPERRTEATPVDFERRVAERRAKVLDEDPHLTGKAAERIARAEIRAEEAEGKAGVTGEQAVTDVVTGLKNARGWEEALKTLDKEKDHVLLADIRGFKPINDKIGHTAGNHVLNSIGNLLKKHFGDETARQGGDEFGAILRNNSLEEATARTEAFRKDLRELRMTVRNKITGESLDIPGFEAHIGVARDAEAADLLSNLERERTGSGRDEAARVEGAPPAERGPEQATPGSPEHGGLGDRPPELGGPPEPPAAAPKYSTRPAPWFFSALSEAVDDVKQPAASGDQWLRTLLSRPGVKAEEAKWTGLDDFLKGRAGQRVSKEEIQSFLRENNVQVKEVVHGDETLREGRNAESWAQEADRLSGEAERAVGRGDIARARELREQANHADEQADRAAGQESDDNGGAPPSSGTTKFGAYTLPGGKNYRELLLTLPGRGADLQAPAFYSGHFDEPNVLAHVRFNERTDAQGKKVLFIEEVQSDWAQKGRREGFQQQKLTELPDGYYVTHERWPESGREAPPGYSGRWRNITVLRRPGGEEASWVAGKGLTMEQLRAQRPVLLSNELHRINGERGKGVASAPFVGSTEGWTGLAMKRVLRYAAENGFDRVAWTTGEQQAARYDLSKHVDGLRVIDMGEGAYHVKATKDGAWVINEPNLPASKLAETIGKDLADKAVADLAAQREKGSTRTAVDYSGLDLKVGGEGMKGYYDQILPAWANKYGKKWGARVGRTALDLGNDLTRMPPFEGPDLGATEIRAAARNRDVRVRQQLESVAKLVEDGRPLIEALPEVGSPAAAEALGWKVGAQPNSVQTVHAMDVTPEMRRSVVEEGQPLFRAGERKARATEQTGGLTLSDVQQHVRGVDVSETPEGFQFKAGKYGVRIDRVGDIYLEPQAFAKGRPGVQIEGQEALGSYQRAGDLATIKLLAKAGETPRTLLHEVWHLVKDLGLLSPGEMKAVEKRYGAEEAQADAYAAWNPKATPNSIFGKILTYFQNVYRSFRPSAESAFEKVRSGKAFEGAPTGEDGGPKYATAPKMPPQAKPIPPGARPGQPAPPTPASGGGPAAAPATHLTLPEATLVDKVATYFQDRLRRLDVVEKAVGEQGGKVRPVGENVKAAADALGAKGGAKIEEIRQKYVDPLVSAVSKAKSPLKDLDDYLSILHAPDRDAVISKRTNGQVKNGSGWTDHERTTRLAELEQKYGKGPNGRITALEPAAKIVRDMRDEQLRVLENGGLISKAQAQAWKAEMGDHYVPLRTAEVDEGIGTGQGFDIRGKESKAATGRSTKADSPVTFMVQQLQRAVIRAEKNKVDQKFADFVRENSLFEMDKEHERTELGKDGKVKTVRDALRDGQDFSYKVNGETHRIDIASTDPLLDRAMRNLSANDRNVVVNALGKVSRHFSKAVTSMNPAFVFTNFARDIQEASTNVGVEHGAKVAKKIVSGIAPAMREMWQQSRDPSKASQMAKEFKEDGGAVGWYSVDSIKDLEKDLTRQISAAGPGAAPAMKRAFSKITRSLADVNATVENATRFATYKALREAGASREKAAHVSRNATLDFTKRGEAGPTINALYTFFNANVQGAKRFKEVLIDNPKGRAAAAAVVAAGMAMDAYNRANAGDANEDGTNDYDDIPEYVKARNWVFMRGAGKKPLLVPIPYGFGVLHTIGRQVMSTVSGATTPGKAAASVVGSAANAFNPLGGDQPFVQQLSPTFLDPFVQHATNKTWSGAPLKPEQYPNAAKKPDSEMFFKNAPPAAIAIARFLNQQTGGDKRTPGYISVSPEVLALYADAANSMFGLGAYVKTGVQAAETAGALAKGETPSLRNIPVASRFVYEESPGLEGQKYRANVDELETLWGRYKGYREEGETEKANEIPKALLQAKQSVDAIDSRIKALRRASKARPDLERRIADLQRQANKLVATAKRQTRGA